MSVLVRNIIGKNVKSIRLEIGLSQLKFSEVTGLSKATIINIETGKTGYNLNLLDNILKFSRYNLNDLSKEDFKPDKHLREKLINIYKEHTRFNTILNNKPEITFAIKQKLLTSNLLDQPREISEIRSFFIQSGWDYHGPSLSNALKRMPDFIEIRKHEKKGNTNVYLRRR